MDIIIGNDLFTSDVSTSIVLPLFLVHDGKYFPCEGWTDFAKIIDMWTYDLLKYKNCRECKFTLYFMDGPYRLDIAKNSEKVLIQCVNFRDNDLIESSILYTYIGLLETVYRASCKFSKILYARGMSQGRYMHVYNQAIITSKKLKEAINEDKGTEDRETVRNH